MYGTEESVKALVEAKAIVDKESKDGRTALMVAVKKMENLMSEKRPQYIWKGLRS